MQLPAHGAFHIYIVGNDNTAFKIFFYNEITRNAANEAQLGKSVVSASSVPVLLTGEELSSSCAFDFQQQYRDGSWVCSHTLNLWKFATLQVLGLFFLPLYMRNCWDHTLALTFLFLWGPWNKEVEICTDIIMEYFLHHGKFHTCLHKLHCLNLVDMFLFLGRKRLDLTIFVAFLYSLEILR